MTLRHGPTMRLLAVLLVLLVTAGCDQATKHLARSQLSQVSSATLPGGFVELTLTQNPGAFLSLAAWRALASWSAAVLCRFRSNRSTRPNVTITSSVHDSIALRD